METKINNQENISCLYCISPLIYYNSFEDPYNIEAFCSKNHKIKYNIKAFIKMRQNYFKDIHGCLTIYSINKCNEHKKELRFCTTCKETFCKKCTNIHRSHETKSFRDCFLTEKQKNLVYDIKRLEYFNNFLKTKIFDNRNILDFENIIYNRRYNEIELLLTLLYEYQKVDYKDIHYPFHLLLNLKFLFFDKYPNIRQLNLFDFINSTEIEPENIPKRNLIINYITHNFYNIKENNINTENNESLIKYNKTLRIKHFIPLKTNDILIISDFICEIYSPKMELKINIDNFYSFECTYFLKKNNNIDNNETIYAFAKGIIYEIEIIKSNDNKYQLNNKTYSCDIDFVRDAIYLNNDYLIICDYKLKSFILSNNIKEYKILEEHTNWLGHINFCGMLLLPNNEFVYLMNYNDNLNNYINIKMKSYINFYQYKNGDNNFVLIKKMNLDYENDLMQSFKNEIIIISSRENGILFINIKYKEIISIIKNMRINYLFIRKNNDIIIKEQFLDCVKLNIYGLEKGELKYKGILQDNLDGVYNYVKDDFNGKIFLIRHQHNNRITKVFVYDENYYFEYLIDYDNGS